jgi:hypothetical protein
MERSVAARSRTGPRLGPLARFQIIRKIDGNDRSGAVASEKVVMTTYCLYTRFCQRPIP